MSRTRPRAASCCWALIAGTTSNTPGVVAQDGAVTIHLDLTGCTHAGLRLHPLAEMMAALHVMAEPEHHAGSSELLDRADRCLSESTRRRIADWTPLWSRYRCSLFFPRRRQPERDAGRLPRGGRR